MKSETGKKQDVMTLSDSDDVQTISSGSEDNKEKEKAPQGKKRREGGRNVEILIDHMLLTVFTFHSCLCCSLPLALLWLRRD